MKFFFFGGGGQNLKVLFVHLLILWVLVIPCVFYMV